MPLSPERADRRRVLKAAAFFLTGVGLAFAAAPRWGAGVGAVLLFTGLFAALLMMVGGGDDDKPPHP
jgi:hypothetical protein